MAEQQIERQGEEQQASEHQHRTVLLNPLNEFTFLLLILLFELLLFFLFSELLASLFRNLLLRLSLLFFIGCFILRLCYFGLKAGKECLSLLLILFVAIDELNVQARIYHQPQGQQQEEHLERREIGHLHT